MNNFIKDQNSIIEKLKDAAIVEPITSFLGFKLLEISSGFARVSLVIRPEFINFNGMVFGGIIMALADQAFAYSSNSVICPNIAAQFNIHLINASKVNDTLTASGKIIKQGKRVCMIEIEVVNQEQKLIARCSGTTIPKAD